MVGDYSNARILVRNSPVDLGTGITDENTDFITDEKRSTLNATSGLNIFLVLAWPTRLAFVEAISIDDSSLPGSNTG